MARPILDASPAPPSGTARLCSEASSANAAGHGGASGFSGRANARASSAKVARRASTRPLTLSAGSHDRGRATPPGRPIGPDRGRRGHAFADPPAAPYAHARLAVAQKLRPARRSSVAVRHASTARGNRPAGVRYHAGRDQEGRAHAPRRCACPVPVRPAGGRGRSPQVHGRRHLGGEAGRQPDGLAGRQDRRLHRLGLRHGGEPRERGRLDRPHRRRHPSAPHHPQGPPTAHRSGAPPAGGSRSSPGATTTRPPSST